MTELTFYRCTDPKLGYGRMGIEIGEEMANQGIDVRNEIDNSPTQIVMWGTAAMHAQGWYTGQTRALITMFEAMNVPMAMRENIELMDIVIVPSKQNQEMYSEFHPNVKFVPLGINPERWHYTPRIPPTDKFFFLVQGRGLRKGLDIAYDALRTAFPEGSWGDGPLPGLIIKSPKVEDAGVAPEHRIGVIGGYATPEMEVDIYRQAHCFLAPSRGEGFGMQPLQAMAQGIPTILTNAHGHTSFARLGIPIKAYQAPADQANFVYGEDVGDWWEPSFSQLVTMMQEVYYNYDAMCAYAKKSAAVIAERFTWKQTVDGIVKVLGPENLMPYKGFKVWYTPPRTLVKVIFNSDHTADMGGYVTPFKAGQVYELTPDQAGAYESQGLVDEGGILRLDQPLATYAVSQGD